MEFTDPGCSYAWGTEPKVRRLRWQYGHLLRWRRVVVGLHPPGWTDGWHEQASPRTLSDYWKGVGAVTGMPFPSPLHHVHASTEVACRLVKAAERQDGVAASGGPVDRPSDRLLRLLRESWFVWGRPADTAERGLALAAAVDGLDIGRLARDVDGGPVEAAFRADLAQARRPNEYVLNKPDKRVGRWARAAWVRRPTVLLKAREVTYRRTEPVIAPVRRVLKPVNLGGVQLDLAFTVVFVATLILRSVVISL